MEYEYPHNSPQEFMRDLYFINNYVMRPKAILKIEKEWTVEDLELNFANFFPFLSIEISFKGSEVPNAMRSMKITDLSRNKAPKEFEISENMTVGQVVEQFWKNIGLQVSILRSMGNSRIETSFTNDWTLERQSKMGGEIMKNYLKAL